MDKVEILSTKLEEILPAGQSMVVIDSRVTVQDAMKTLIQNNIYSAPVYSDTHKKYIGFLDLVDIVTATVSSVEMQVNSHNNLSKLLEKVGGLEIHKSSEDLSAKNPIVTVGLKDTVLQAMIQFKKTGVRRLAVVEDGNEPKIINILSEATVVQWLSKNIDQLGPIVNKKLQETGIGLKKVLSIQKKQPAIEAFKMMAEHRITGVAVVNKEGKLFSIISAKDMKEVDLSPPFSTLYLKTSDFVALVRNRQLKESVPAMYVRPENTLGETIHKIVFLKLHRLFIVDDEKNVIGVITLGDIVDSLIPPGYL